MGQTLLTLSNKDLKDKAVFNNRFVVEVCEAIHVHYRNMRLILSLNDWISLASGMRDSLSRWESRKNPEPSKDNHIELCRKEVATNPIGSDSITINLNKNLYPHHEGRIFSEGAGIEDNKYIHLKIRDIRLELSIDDFKILTDAVKEAEEKLCALA